MEKLREGDKGAKRSKKLQKRRTFHGSSSLRRSFQTGIIDYAGGFLTKTPVNKSYSVRKPLQVVSASKASSNSSFFSSTRMDKSSFVNKMFGTKTVDPVVKSKTPVAFTTPKPQGVLSSNLRYGKTDIVEDCISEDCQSPDSLGISSEDFSHNGEKPTVLPSLLSRKSKKLDFVTKDLTNVKTGGLKSRHDKMPTVSLITATKLSFTSPKSSVSSMVTKATVSSVIAKSSSSSSLTNQSTSSSMTILSSSSLSSRRVQPLSLARMKLSVSSAVPNSSSSSCRIVPSSSTMKSLAVTESSSSSSSSMIASCMQSNIKQESSHSVHDEPEVDEEFSNLFARNMEKKDSNSSRNQDLLVCSGEKQNKDEGKPERKKLKVSRRSSGPSSRKALQEARIQGLKNNHLKNSTKELEIGCSLSLTTSPHDNAEILPSSIPEADQIFIAQKSTPSSRGSINKPTLGTESPSSASTTDGTSHQSSTKINKDWMHLFEEPFPRRSPRLSSLPSSTTKDQEYLYLMENFSPLTSQRRARRRKKQSRGRSNCSQENSSTRGSADDQSVVLKDVKAPVSPLVLAEKEASPPVLQTPAAEDCEKKKEEPLKRDRIEKPEKNVSSKKKKSNACLNQPEENDSLDPATSPHVSEDEMFHFPRPPAVLSGAGGPYSMVVDFALPDKDYAKLKLAKIKGNQRKKSAYKDYGVMPTYCEKQSLNENIVTDRDKESKSVKAGRDATSHGVDRLVNSDMNSVESKADIKETNMTNEKEMDVVPRERKESDLLSCEVDDDDDIIPATPKTKSITTENRSNDNQSEGTFTVSTDSEHVLSGSILKNLQVPSIVDKNCKPAVTQSLGDLDSSSSFENKHLSNSVASPSLSKHRPEFGGTSVEKRSPEMQKMPTHKNESHGLQKHGDNSKNYFQEEERSPTLEECDKFVGNEMKGNEMGIKREKLPPGKECVPSSQGSSTSQSPNDLKGLLVLNGKVEEKSHPISNSNHALPPQEWQQEQSAGSDTLDNSENMLSCIPGNLSGTVPLTSKSERAVIQNSIREDGQMIGESQKHEDDNTVLGGIEVTKICNGKQTLLCQEKHDLEHVNQVSDHLSRQDLKTAKELPCSSKNNIELVSAVNQPNLDTTGVFPLGDTEMGSPVNQVEESHCGVDSVLHDTGMGSPVNQVEESHCGVDSVLHDTGMGSLVNQVEESHCGVDSVLHDTGMGSPVNQVEESHCGVDNVLHKPEMGSPVNQVEESHCGVDCVLHDTEMGSIASQQSQNSECVQVANGNFENTLMNIKGTLCCNTGDFDDNTPGSIKGSVPLYSNPEESNEQDHHQDGSFLLCPDTEEFSCHMVPEVPVDQNTEEFGIAELVSLEPSIGDTATPHGKASVPQGSSVMDNDMRQAENRVLTPVLMQACLQHDNSESSAVLSISMSTYDIPGHVVNKKKDVMAVCLSHWVVVWIKMAGQEWTVLKTWTLDNADSEMFQMVKFLPFTSHLVLLVGGKFISANGRVYGYSKTTSYDFQLDYKDVNDLMSFSSMCVLTDEEQSSNNDGDIELVIAGAIADGHVVTKWSLDCHCSGVKKCQVFALPNASGAITSLLTVDGNNYLLIGSTGTHLLLWNSKSCDLLKEINLPTLGLYTFDCLHAVTEVGLVFLTMCQRPATQKEKCASSCLLYALNPLSNRLQCLQSFSFQEQTVRCSSVGGQYLALGHQDGMARLVKIAAPQHSATFPVFQGAIETVSFHPSRPIIAFGGGKNACVHVYSLS